MDDNAVNRRIITLQIQRWGMHAQSTGSPHETLEWLCQNVRFDLAILDLWMPEMDGIELAGQTRELTQPAEEMPIGPSTIPLILLSSLGNVGKEIPPDLFAVSLNKPVRLSSLLDALMGIFSKQNIPEPTIGPLHLYVEKEKILPLRILVVDDYMVNQKVALLLLERLGYRADIAANGLEAIQALERQPYDVILMGMQMHEMDGQEACRHIGPTPAVRSPRVSPSA